MSMTEIGMVGIFLLLCLLIALVVRIWAAFTEKEDGMVGRETFQNDIGIGQTTGNKELQADRVWVERSSAGILAVVADGIGKKNTGQVCAQIAIDTVLDRYEPYTVLSEPDYFFRIAFYEANRRIQETLGERRGGASLGAVFVNKTHLYYAIAGNIQIALFRGGELIPLSQGQTLDVLAVKAWEDGKLSRQEAIWSMEEKRLWNYLGLDGFHEIEIGSQPVQIRPGDIALLATCGISEEISWSELEDILVGPGDLQEKAERVIRLAEEKEGTQKENGSVLLLGTLLDAGKPSRSGGTA